MHNFMLSTCHNNKHATTNTQQQTHKQHTKQHKTTTTTTPPPGAGHRVVVEGLSTRQDFAPDSGSQEPARGHRCGWLHRTERCWSTLLRGVLRHGCRVMESAFLLSRDAERGSLVARAKVSRFAQSAPSRKGRWERWLGRGGGGGGRRGAGYVWTVYEMACFLFHVQWTSSCDHAATSSAVLCRFSY